MNAHLLSQFSSKFKSKYLSRVNCTPNKFEIGPLRWVAISTYCLNSTRSHGQLQTFHGLRLEKNSSTPLIELSGTFPPTPSRLKSLRSKVRTYNCQLLWTNKPDCCAQTGNSALFNFLAGQFLTDIWTFVFIRSLSVIACRGGTSLARTRRPESKVGLSYESAQSLDRQRVKSPRAGRILTLNGHRQIVLKILIVQFFLKDLNRTHEHYDSSCWLLAAKFE